MLRINIFLLISVFFNLALSFNIDKNAISKNEDNGAIPEYHGQYKGINIGGWLVTEPYITPSLYKDAIALAKKKGSKVTIIDEYTLCEALGHDDTKELLETHFKTWITEDDFKKISDEGFNYVKIPIGFWAWKIDNETNLYPGNITHNDAYINSNQKKYLDKALEWALKYNLKVVVELYAVHNSGNYFNIYDDLEDTYWEEGNIMDVTSEILKNYFDYMLKLDSPSSLSGLEVLFAPISDYFNDELDLTGFYANLFASYQTTKNDLENPNPNVTFMIQQKGGFLSVSENKLNLALHDRTSPYYKGENYTSDSNLVEEDIEFFNCFDSYNFHNTTWPNIPDSILRQSRYLSQDRGFQIYFAGRWSAALTDCATWLNGIRLGAVFDNTLYPPSYKSGGKGNISDYGTGYGTCVSQNPIDQWPEEYKIQTRKYIEAQLLSFSTYTKGWFFWNWKTESAPEWDYQKLRKHDLFPHPFDNYTYYEAIDDSNSSASKNETPTSSVRMVFTTSSSARSSVVSSNRTTTSKTSSETDSSGTSTHSGKTSSTSSTSSTHSNNTMGSQKNGSYAIKSPSVFASIFAWSLMMMCFTHGIGFLV
ncbi:exoglucanase repeat family protein [Vanderwaltozyma polyspora DSM 70294]|uniref:Exoglucanase repeat family protein n=1 Tax=Vanderwaltozyma polyspora (strain ATCC 22028 / DSM 70294 / BCRC 21397 / CBS 2163 / NBRC 10782 / NRRL Y-8283 / UCD 57-17) TaxID=436907 RepID=A7TTL6_VANPO|nr:exoglucanase repeat family protein [Vanderwaltozyma polyspora DSM 70294]EDO14390.1 exoglucanase repeat family protein [Vanderwaltozyma polyspora DSM 70294]